MTLVLTKIVKLTLALMERSITLQCAMSQRRNGKMQSLCFKDSKCKPNWLTGKILVHNGLQGDFRKERTEMEFHEMLGKDPNFRV